MRTLAFLKVSSITAALVWSASFFWAAPAWPQVNDAERAAARQLFKEGDELQRAGKFAEALDKFQRAETVYSAPTNVLRVAECQAALGHLVESAESYRLLLRMPMPPGSPPAFQTAVDQAKGELAQVEPRVPKLLVQVAPGTVANAQMQIDGQSVSGALIGEPIPLDPGSHRVRVSAPGFASAEQEALLKERETTTVLATLRPAAAATPLPPPPVALPPLSAAPGPTTASATPPIVTGPAPLGVPPPYGVPPPPPPPVTDKEVRNLRKPSRTGLLLGGHLGWEVTGGRLPTSTSTVVDANQVAANGLAYAVEGGLRFARQWVIGIALEHAELGHGDLSSLSGGVTDANASTTLLAAFIGLMGNPDRVSFYGELGAGTRWLSLNQTSAAGGQESWNFNSGELTLGLGVWIPAGNSLRVLPKLTLGLGSFSPPNDSSGGSLEGHTFVMLGVAGFYNLDF
jgi:PEGA domain